MLMFLMTGVLILNACASRQIQQPPLLHLASPLSDVAKTGGDMSCSFSYLMEGKKYDLISFANSPSLVVFEDGGLYAVIPKTEKVLLDQLFTEGMRQEELPLEKCLDSIHSWVKKKKDLNHNRCELENYSSSFAETAGASVIMAAGLPILFPFIAVGAMGDALTTKQQALAKTLNDSLANSDASFSGFLSQLPKPSSQISKGSYSVSFYNPVQSFWTHPSEYVYIVGSCDGKVTWVAFNSFQILQKFVAYEKAKLSAH
ncbi:MAG TPA: hypothetical protein VJ624_03575, partial [Thermodesulfobacteriota bacterium]|nr:hypothetical protein [Thermodesulfobacteriota bacterium]